MQTLAEIQQKTPIEKMYQFNRSMTDLGKRAISELCTEEVESILQNLSLLMAGDYGESKNIDMPVDVVRQTAMFASISLSRLLWERYKLEKQLGRPVVDRKPNDLTDALIGTKLEQEEK